MTTTAMTLLVQQIEALGRHVAGAHDQEMQMIARLAADIGRREAELAQALQALLASHEQHRLQVAQAVAALGARIGGVPTQVGPVDVGPDVAAGDGGRHGQLRGAKIGASFDPLMLYPRKDRAA